MMRALLEYAGDLLIIALGLIMLLNFSWFLIHGVLCIHEGNPYILWIEWGLSFVVIGFGAWHLRSDVKDRRKRDAL